MLLKFFRRFFLACMVAATLLANAAAPDPVAYYEAAMKNPHLQTTDGELFCWHAQGAATELVQGFEATHDVRWLEGAERYFDFLLTKLSPDPDGREGWIGGSIWGTPGRRQLDAYRIDAVVGDAILLAPMVRFAELVRAEPAVTARFGASADRYLEKARKIGWEKWNARDTYYRDAAGFGSYRMPRYFIDAKTGQWVPSPVVPHSENLNKHSAMGLVMLRLWRVTRNEAYRVRAEEIFSRLKHLFRYYADGDRVTWNFWMPHGPHDFDQDKLASWIGVHPDRPNYQSEEVARMVEVYDSGLVFNREDMQRLVNANHFMMPRDDRDAWRSSDGSSNAGKLWASLARFDEEIRTRWRASLANSPKLKDRLDLAYDDEVTARQLGWRRRFVQNELDVRVFAQAPQPGPALAATVVIPDAIDLTKGEVARLVTQTKAGGSLVIDLLSEDGRDMLGEIYRGEADAAGAVIFPEWDGTNPRSGRKEPGAYQLRWRLRDEVRKEWVWLRATRAGAPTVTASSHQGNYTPENAIDGDLATRWSAEGNEQWLQLDFGSPREITSVEIAFTQGDRRHALFVLQASADGQEWRSLFEGQSSGMTAGFERFYFEPMTARYVRYLGYGNSDNPWNSVSELKANAQPARSAP